LTTTEKFFVAFCSRYLVLRNRKVISDVPRGYMQRGSLGYDGDGC